MEIDADCTLIKGSRILVITIEYEVRPKPTEVIVNNDGDVFIQEPVGTVHVLFVSAVNPVGNVIYSFVFVRSKLPSKLKGVLTVKVICE